MNDKQVIRISKFLSLILRHNPGKIGLELDSNGWAEVEELLAKMKQAGKSVSRDVLDHVVETNSKKRFIFSDDGTRIRANQGHSIDIDLSLSPVTPPDHLYHGTATRFIESIQEEGLSSRNRQHLHLSEEIETAINVGSRHGKPIVLVIDAIQMHRDNCLFYKSDNGVWLTESVPAQYIEIPDSL